MSSLKDVKRCLTQFFERAKIRLETAFATVNERPIFILGNQKSGTTAIAALLAEYSGRTVTLDFPMISSQQLVQVTNSALSIDAFIQLHRFEFSRDIIKEPHLTFLFSALAKRFDEPQSVMIVRDPRANLRSILNRLCIPGNLKALEPAKQYCVNDQWRPVLDGTWMGLEGSNYIEMLAARWNRAVDTYLEHQKSMLLIRYEDFLYDKVSCIKQLAIRLGLSRVNDITSKVDVQYQPRGNRDVAWIDFFGPKNLSLIEQVCGHRMRLLGYDPTDRKLPHQQLSTH